MENLREFLNLGDGLKVIKYKHFKNYTEVDVELNKKIQTCPKCKKETNWIQNIRKQKVRDVNFGDKKMYLIVNKKRYRCKYCGKTFIEENDFLNAYQRMTKRLMNEILIKLGSERSFSSIAKDYNLSVNTIIRVFDRLEYPKANLENVEVVAIDEFKGNTGGEKYNCILADPKTKQVLDILPNRKYNNLSEYFKNKKRKNVKYFVSDMWQPYKDLAKVFFKDATFVVDKYHWTRQIIWAFEKVRKEEQKKFYKKYRVYFKCSRSLLLKKFNFLNEDDKQKVNIMLYKSDNIRFAHNLKEEFLEILSTRCKEKAKKLMSDWIMYAQNSGLKAFEKCSNTFYTNGFIEGCNNKIKVLKRNAYGYKNFKRFRNRILHMFLYNKGINN